MEQDKDKIEQKQTPIIDGDARPDINIDPVNEKKDKPRNKSEKDKFSKDRMSDVNSLEDFKDAKE